MGKFWPTVSNKMALRLLKWSEFFYYFLVILPVIVVLYQNKGITVGDFFLIQGISALAAFVLEIPSGYLSGRRFICSPMVGCMPVMVFGILHLQKCYWVLHLPCLVVPKNRTRTTC